MKKTRISLSRSGVTSSVVYHSVNSAGKEDKSNKVSQFSDIPDDEHYPTEKLCFDAVEKERLRALESETILRSTLNTCQKVGSYAWNKSSNMDTITAAGVYNIHGERLSNSDGLPIDNFGSGHMISGRLNVIDSSADTTNVCVTQVLELSNKVGGDANIYIRTGTSQSGYAAISWSSWQKLQGLVNIPITKTLDGLIDNGMYSGVLIPSGDMFLLVVINNYAAVANTGNTRSVAQLKYSLSLDGSVSLQKRVGSGDGTITWKEWTSV